jgi:hypothetical protein
VAQLQPKDPLDDPITRFVNAVNEFLDFKVEDIAPTKPASTGDPVEDIKRGWDEVKRLLRKGYDKLVGARPEVDGMLERIVSTGSEILGMTDDEHIVVPVQNAVRLASDERIEIERMTTWMGKATSIGGVTALMLELLGFGNRSKPRREQIANELNDLTAYYLMRTPPPKSA